MYILHTYIYHMKCYVGYIQDRNWDDQNLQVAVKDIIAVEEIKLPNYDDGLFYFQVLYGREKATRRIVISRVNRLSQLIKWINSLRNVCHQNSTWLTAWHSGFYFHSGWTCCSEKEFYGAACLWTSTQGSYVTEDNYSNYQRMKKEKDETANVLESVRFQGFKCLLTQNVKIKGRSVKKGDAVFVSEVDTKSSNRLVTLLGDRDVQGYVSADNLRMEDIREEAWFFQEVPPNLATTLLQKMASGTFIVRSFKKRLSMSIVTDDVVRHIWIHQDTSGLCYVLQHKRFPSLQEMVLHYSQCDDLGSKLIFYPRKDNLEKLWYLDPSQLILKDVISEPSLPFIIKTGAYSEQNVTAYVSKFKQSKHEIQILRNEARMLMCLEHDNLLPLVGVHVTSSSFSLVLGPVQGGSLLNFLRSRGEGLISDWELLLTASHQICNAAMYLHKKGIVHNELILENWNLTTEPFAVKLTCFHFAKFEDCRPNALLEDMFHKYCRVCIMPPEVSALKQSTTCQSDLWAMGLLIWRLFCLGASIAEPLRLELIANTQWPQLPNDLSVVLTKIIQSCLHEIPQLRLSAFELAKQFRGLLELRKILRRGERHTSNYPVLFENRRVNYPTARTSHGSNSSTNDFYSDDNATYPGHPMRKRKSKRRRFFSRKKGAYTSSSSSPQISRSERFDGVASSTNQKSSSSLSIFRGFRNKFSRSRNASSTKSLTTDNDLQKNRDIDTVFQPLQSPKSPTNSSYIFPQFYSDVSLSGDCSSSIQAYNLPRTLPYRFPTIMTTAERKHSDQMSTFSDLSGDALSTEGSLFTNQLSLNAEDLRTQCEHLLTQNRSLKRSLRRERREKTRLEERILATESEKLNEKNEYGKKIDELENQIMEKDTEIRKLNQNKNLLEKTYQEKVDLMREEITNFTKEIERLEKQKQKDCDTLQKKIEDYRKENENMARNISLLETENKRWANSFIESFEAPNSISLLKSSGLKTSTETANSSRSINSGKNHTSPLNSNQSTFLGTTAPSGAASFLRKPQAPKPPSAFMTSRVSPNIKATVHPTNYTTVMTQPRMSTIHSLSVNNGVEQSRPITAHSRLTVRDGDAADDKSRATLV